jgi:phosphomannomutase / phosphoglucomutase
MYNMPKGIFKKYDIRGVAEGKDAVITPDIARWIGLSFGTHLQRNVQINRVVVGRDNRRSSFSLYEALVDGLVNSGCNVIKLDLVATPVVYWHAVRESEIGGVMVTGSHLSPHQNGFKFCVGNKSVYGSQIQLMRSFIESGDLTYGSGSQTVNLSSYSRYVDDLASRLPMQRSLRVVVDAGNGIAGLFTDRLMKAFGHEMVECLYCELDGNFPNHPANPQEVENMRALGEKVRATDADIGIAFDGDADRMGVVDENGEVIVADRVFALLARDLLKRKPGAAIVADVLSSQALFDEIRECGGIGVMSASGHSLVKAKMADTNALLGGEMSGHIFLKEDYYGFDDGFFAAGRLLQFLASENQTMSMLDASLPRYFSTPEYRPYCADSDKRLVIDGVQSALRDAGEMITVDGIRLQFENGWGLLRASNTEPVLSLRFEGKTEADALQYRDLFFNALRAYPQVELNM